jgi:DNA-binding Lrp family transcriptional regulator
LLDFAKLGFNHHTNIALKVDSKQKKDLLLFLQRTGRVNAIYEINGGFDFLIEMVHKDIKEYTTFLEELQRTFDILNVHTYQIIDEISKEIFLPQFISEFSSSHY